MPSLIVKFVVVVDVVAHIYKHTNSSYQGTFVVQLPFYFLSFAFCISYVCFSFVPFVYVLPDFHFVKEKRVASFSLSRKLFLKCSYFHFYFRVSFVVFEISTDLAHESTMQKQLQLASGINSLTFTHTHINIRHTELSSLCYRGKFKICIFFHLVVSKKKHRQDYKESKKRKQEKERETSGKPKKMKNNLYTQRTSVFIVFRDALTLVVATIHISLK